MAALSALLKARSRDQAPAGDPAEPTAPERRERTAGTGSVEPVRSRAETAAADELRNALADRRAARRQEGASALDRIRELAKRQEELSRQQRDLASSELAVRRSEARARKADARADRAAQAGRRSGQADGSSHAAGREPVRNRRKACGRAADQMRSAASELGRDDVASAAARGEQAARELRNLEAQMQSATPDARRRALGELQLESQQAADAQRRIANEAQGMDRPGSSADARRRLAGEKEELADRVEALRQSARRLAADPKTATSRSTGRLRRAEGNGSPAACRSDARHRTTDA